LVTSGSIVTDGLRLPDVLFDPFQAGIFTASEIIALTFVLGRLYLCLIIPEILDKVWQELRCRCNLLARGAREGKITLFWGREKGTNSGTFALFSESPIDVWELCGSFERKVIDVVDCGAPNTFSLNLRLFLFKGLLYSLLYVDLLLADLLLIDQGILGISPE
jgi:hypothetical protein